MRFFLLLICIITLSTASVNADSTMTTFSGVLQESNHTGMTKLYNSPRWRNENTYLIERTGRFTIGNSVSVTGYIKTTRKDYDYPVLHVQSIDADSAKTTYRGVLERSKYSGMTKLKLLFYLPFLDYSYLIERTGNFEIGDSVVVTGDDKITTREYDYPVLHVQSIDGFTMSEDSDSDELTINGKLVESQYPHTFRLVRFKSLNSYVIERAGNFSLGDYVTVTGHIKGTNKQYGYSTVLHVQSIDEYDCCINNVRGDVNLDGKIDLADLIMLSANLQGYYKFNNCDLNQDINGDTLFNQEDYYYLYDYIMHCGPEPVDCDIR